MYRSHCMEHSVQELLQKVNQPYLADVNVSNVTHVGCSSVDNMLQSLPMEAFGLEGDLHVDDHGMM